MKNLLTQTTSHCAVAMQFHSSNFIPYFRKWTITNECVRTTYISYIYDSYYVTKHGFSTFHQGTFMEQDPSFMIDFPSFTFNVQEISMFMEGFP